MLANLRLAFRALLGAPTFAVAAVLCIALGIGANTAIFSVVDAVLLHPLPARDLDRMVVLREDLPKVGFVDAELDPPTVADLAARRDLFARAAGVQSTRFNLSVDGTEPARIGAARTLGDFFPLFGARAAVGRLYAADQSRDGRDKVAVLAYGFWQERFGGDPRVVGRRIQLSGVAYEIVGVAAPELRYPRTADVWTPYPVDSTLAQQHGRLIMHAIATLQPGVGAERLRDALARQVRDWAAARDDASDPAANMVLHATPFASFLAGELRPIVILLMGAVAFVLLIACANVACLQLVRATGRVRELAVRAALGAPAVRALGRWGPTQYPMLRDVRLDPTVLAFAVLATVAAAVLFGVAPALRAARVDPQDALRAATRGASAGVERHRFLQGAVVVQVALALTLLLGSGLLFRSLAGLIATDPGFRPDQVLTAQLATSRTMYPSEQQRQGFVDGVLERVAATPGVQAAGIASFLPFGGNSDSSPFEIVGRPQDPNAARPHANYNIVSDDYLRAMGIALRAGRGFQATDVRGGPAVVLVDETLARQYFPGESAIGKRITQLGGLGDDPLVIVGVVANVKQENLGQEEHATIYYSYRQVTPGSFAVALRSTLPPASLTGAVRAAVAQLNPQVPVYDVRLMRERVDQSLGAQRLAVWVLGAFAGLALTLAVLGISGVLSYTVTQRTHELGIRVALGAQRGAIVRMVVRQGAILTAVGLAGGLALFLAAGRVMGAMLHGVGARDPLTVAAATATLAGVALLASWIPARRAARADGTIVLRS